ncbi:MAG: response regulator [Usitatibacter sp.]
MSNVTSKSIGKYEIVGIISKGARASIYRGVDIDTRRAVAVKILKRSTVIADALSAFRKQSQVLARLEHPSMAAFFDVVENEKAIGLVSDICEGKAIAGLLREGAHPEIKSVWDLVRPMLESLAAAHALGVTHRDVKPSNMILAPDGRVRVTDFGMATLLNLAPEEIHYHAPEQFEQGTLGPRTDVYQAATVIYQLITGKLPFTGTPDEIAHRVRQERPNDPSSFDNRIAWQLDWVLQKALSKDPVDRFPSAAEFAEGLRLGLQETVARPLEHAVTSGRRAAANDSKAGSVMPPTPVSFSFAPGQEEESLNFTAAASSRPAAAPAPNPAAASIATPVAVPVAPTAPATPERMALEPLEFKPSVELPTAPPPAPAPTPAAPAQAAPTPAAPAPAATATPAPVATVAPPDNGKPRILFVDDDERILNALRALFRADYQVQTATNGDAGLEIVNRGGLDVVVSDQRMPGLTGVELLRKVRAASPNSVRLLLTGYTDMASLVGSINDGEIFRFVKKPWDNTELRSDIAEAVKVSKERARAPVVESKAPRSAGSLLVIDPKEGLARGLERLLAGEAEVIQVTSPAEAAKAMHQREVAAIVADMGAGMDGLVSLFKQVKAKRPNVLTILLSDEPDSELGIELINKAQIFRFLVKPVSAKELRHNVADALRRYAAARDSALAQGNNSGGDDSSASTLARSA